MLNRYKDSKKYTFNDYFEMSCSSYKLVAAFGYEFQVQQINLPISSNIDKTLIESLKTHYYLVVPKIPTNSEIVKRELMIAPVLHSVIRNVDAILETEYCLNVNDKLSGIIDYFFHSKQELIIIEAKKGDLERGFNQLATEMIAMDIYEKRKLPKIIYGAISIGEIWRFALLDRKEKKIIKDIHTFRFPEDLIMIFSILQGILEFED